MEQNMSGGPKQTTNGRGEGRTGTVVKKQEERGIGAAVRAKSSKGRTGGIERAKSGKVGKEAVERSKSAKGGLERAEKLVKGTGRIDRAKKHKVEATVIDKEISVKTGVMETEMAKIDKGGTLVTEHVDNGGTEEAEVEDERGTEKQEMRRSVGAGEEGGGKAAESGEPGVGKPDEEPEENGEAKTTTRTTRMVYMEEISQAGSTVPTEASDSKHQATESATPPAVLHGPATTPVRDLLSPSISPSLRRRSLHLPSSSLPANDQKGEVVITVPSTVIPLPSKTAQEECPKDLTDDVQDEDTFEEIPRTKTPDVTFKQKARAISNAIKVTRPRESQGPSGQQPTFRKTVSRVGKMVSGFKGIHNMEEMSSLTDTLLYDLLKPMFRAMMISGLFFVRPEGAALFQHSHRRCLRTTSLAQIYSLFILMVLTVNFVRSLLAFRSEDGFGYVLFFKLLWCILWYDSATRCLHANVMWFMRKGGLQAYFVALEKVCYSDGIIPYENGLKKTCLQLSITMACFGLTAFGSFAYGFFWSEHTAELFDTVLQPIPGDGAHAWVYKSVLLAVIGLNILVSCLSLAFYILLCYILYKEFEYLCRTFGMKISSEGQFVDDLEKFRIAHQQRCKLVEQADQIFKYFIANIFTAHVPLLCLLMYNLLDLEQSMVYRLYGLYWMLLIMVQSVTVAVAATMVNTQVNMFLNKLTGTSIGLTAWDMFVINKPTMLTVIGMILTFFFLIVQLRNPLESGVTLTACDCALYNASGHDVTQMYTVSNVM